MLLWGSEDGGVQKAKKWGRNKIMPQEWAGIWYKVEVTGLTRNLAELSTGFRNRPLKIFTAQGTDFRYHPEQCLKNTGIVLSPSRSSLMPSLSFSPSYIATTACPPFFCRASYFTPCCFGMAQVATIALKRHDGPNAPLKLSWKIAPLGRFFPLPPPRPPLCSRTSAHIAASRWRRTRPGTSSRLKQHFGCMRVSP